jgi:hypothetical protein
MLVSSAQVIRQLLRPAGGRLIASGFDGSERQRVEQALELTVDAAFVEEGWVGLVLAT